jgi:ornithine cyclodeaminase/alanine dehydrogenase-like protein (mu-crystallin family)
MRQISTEEIRRAGRRSEDEITVFKSVGNAVEDLAVASLIVG